MVNGTTYIGDNVYKYKIKVNKYGYTGSEIRIYYKKNGKLLYSNFQYGIYDGGIKSAVNRLECLSSTKKGLDAEVGDAIYKNLKYKEKYNKWV